MIRLNLLKPLKARVPERQRATGWNEPAGRPPRKKKRAWILIPFVIALVIAAAGVYFSLHGVKSRMPKAESTEEAEATPAAAPAMMSTTTDTASTPISADSLDFPPVTGGGQEAASEAAATETPMPEAAPAAMPATSAPATERLENISAQYFRSRRLLRDLQASAPPGVGFSSVVFTPPGDFTVRGVASSDADLQHFQGALAALPGAALQPGQTQPAGKTARIFAFSGQVHYPVPDSSQNRVIPIGRLNAAIQRFVLAAKAENIDLPQPELRDSSSAGPVRSFLYHVDATCDYAQLQTLLDKLQAAHSGVGVQRLELQAKGAENMLVSLDLILYAQ